MRTKGQIKKNNTTLKGKTAVKEEEDADTDVVVPKKVASKPIEIEETDVAVEIEKPVDDAVVEDGEGEDAEEVGLSEEDIDPFGDKWEQ